MTTETVETVLDERTSESTRALAFEIAEEDLEALRSEHNRLNLAVNPGLPWPSFLKVCLAMGLERLGRMSASEALELIDRLES